MQSIGSQTQTTGVNAAGRALLIAGACALAVEPVVWLARTWTRPAYNSAGGWVFAGVVGLFVWSLSSRLAGGADDGRHRRLALALLGLTALIRLAGQVLAIAVLGALALAVDVFALAVWARLSKRRRAVSPLWLAGLFVFSLPVERIFQRLVGYGLQHVSAAGACGVLQAGFDDVACAGVEITLGGTPVLVDLPCSGARGLVLILVLFGGLAALVRPRLKAAAAGLATALGAAYLANVLRIAALSVGIAFPEVIGGADVMAQPWHDVVGLAALALGVAPLVVWARLCSGQSTGASASSACGTRPGRPGSDERPGRPGSENNRTHLLAGLALVALAAALPLIPHEPVDVSRPIDEVSLPTMLGGHTARRQPLSALEADFFTRYGGAAAKAEYGAHGLLVVRTSAPLRHMHAPDECLSGAGHRVETRGVTGHNLPAATYRSTDPQGRQWRVMTSWVSDQGHFATSVSEVVWRWMQRPESTWTAVERWHRWQTPIAAVERFDAAVVRALELPVRQYQVPLITRTETDPGAI